MNLGEYSEIVYGIIITVLNILESFLLIRRGKKRKNHETLILSLSLSDALVGTATFSFELLTVFDKLNVFSVAKQKMELIKTYAECPIWFSVYASIFHLSAITFDRAMAVIYPAHHRFWVNPSRIKICIIFAWLTSAAIIIASAICTMGLGDADLNSREHQMKTVVAGFCLIVGFAIALSYILIFKRAVLDGRKEMKNLRRNTQERKASAKERRLSFICLAIILSFVACMFPYAIEIFYRGEESDAGNFMLISNSFINPITYFYWQYLERKRGKL